MGMRPPLGRPWRRVSSLHFFRWRGVGAAAPIQMRLPGGVYVNAPGGEGDESWGRHLLSSGNSNRMRLLLSIERAFL